MLASVTNAADGYQLVPSNRLREKGKPSGGVDHAKGTNNVKIVDRHLSPS